ncbi:MAG TPA: hypothetical protein VK530_05895 [Candidatus Acidoferrum sp.]|nr:hypothetical protein [Candidatus Acidoferrum sp.]
MLLVLSGMLLMALLQHVFSRTPVITTAGSGFTTKPAGMITAPSRNTPSWGKLAYTPFALERPQAYFSNELGQAEVQWLFRNYSEARLTALFMSLDLSSEARAFLVDPAKWQRLPDGFRISPPPLLVRDLKPETRAKLYDVLASWPENSQHNPFQFRADGFDEWFSQSGLPPDKVELARKLTYRQGNLLLFSDGAVFSKLATPAESLALVRSLWRVSTFIMSVRIAPDTDANSLLQYWARGERAFSVRPLVESIARLPQGASINVADLLPPFARVRLYTFPPPDDAHAIREDCFWTAMNFFNDRPDDRFFDPKETIATLKSDYVRITDGRKEFGDVLMLFNKEGQALHMCVYIADDVVFTKNGFNVAQPYVLMKLDEMLGWYQHERPFDVMTYRRRSLMQTPVRLSMYRPAQ